MDMKRDFLAEYSGECLYHHGIMGQKWGVRRFQNKDGSLTEAGRKRYLNESGELNDKGKKRFLSRDDGTYYDLTKYSRKLGALGGLIDTARYAKEVRGTSSRKTVQKSMLSLLEDLDQKQKDTDEKMVPERNAEFKDSLNKGSNKWRYSESEDGNVHAVLNSKLGENSVRFNVNFDSRKAEMLPKYSAESINEAVDKYVKEYNKVMSTVSESVAEKYYDGGLFGKSGNSNNVSRDEFKALVKNQIKDIDLDANGEEPSESTFWFNKNKNSNLFGDDVVSVDYDILYDIAYDPESH